jgi:hypothetical protein
VFLPWLAFNGTSCASCLLAALGVAYLSPLAAGSGIPHIMAYCNGVDIPGLLVRPAACRKALRQASEQQCCCACFKAGGNCCFNRGRCMDLPTWHSDQTPVTQHTCVLLLCIPCCYGLAQTTSRPRCCCCCCCCTDAEDVDSQGPGSHVQHWGWACGRQGGALYSGTAGGTAAAAAPGGGAASRPCAALEIRCKREGVKPQAPVPSPIPLAHTHNHLCTPPPPPCSCCLPAPAVWGMHRLAACMLSKLDQQQALQQQWLTTRQQQQQQLQQRRQQRRPQALAG